MVQARPGPALSVVIVSFNRRLDLLERCLRAVIAQDVSNGMEVIVVRDRHSGDADHAVTVARQFPHVTWLEARDGTVPQMRRLGVAESRGDVVALIEDDCIVAADWTTAIIRAHAGPHVAVGGAVEPGTYRSSLDWAAYFCDYARFMLPFARREASVLPGNNVSYKRQVVPELLEMTEREGLQETFVHEAWQRQRKPMLADPRIVVRDEHTWRIADVSRVPFHHARAFAGRRAQRWGLEQKLAFAVATAALPLVHVARVLLRVLTRRRAILPLAGALPWVALFGLCWAAGECVGYACGPGDSLRRWR